MHSGATTTTRPKRRATSTAARIPVAVVVGNQYQSLLRTLVFHCNKDNTNRVQKQVSSTLRRRSATKAADGTVRCGFGERPRVIARQPHSRPAEGPALRRTRRAVRRCDLEIRGFRAEKTTDLLSGPNLSLSLQSRSGVDQPLSLGGRARRRSGRRCGRPQSLRQGTGLRIRGCV